MTTQAEFKVKNPIDWVTTIFLLTSPLVGIFGTLYVAVYETIHLGTWALFLFYFFATGMGITVGYHRLFSHKAYEAKSLIKLLLLLFGAAAFQSTALEWSEDHRIHHKFVDTDKDPYSIKKGFWYAHIGWLFRKRNYVQQGVQDLASDPLVLWQHKHFYSISIFMCFILPGLITMLWGSFLEGFFVAGFLRLFVVHQFTFFINSACHVWGERTFSKEQTARDNWVIAFFTFGEGFHNFHHEFQMDYRNGIRWYDYDPSKWMIKFLSFFGLTYNLKKVSEEKILQKTMFIKEKETLHQFANLGEEKLKTWSEQLAHLRETAIAEFQKWSKAKQTANEKEAVVSKEKFETTKENWEKLLSQPLFF
ncbi:acyl-CoA desaturase [Leptospira biflexa]|uniref:acyl-CoA desaturase n=1 Tax=Leptospira biflexa TaxID=172 RepID=UPI001090B10E|nr:fatty acid desaturase [Leptospira biflexa]TGM46511.1 acyl-CoA desaturase [Leptospira biflexa]TGM51027.1 acyl-CoA desaturase [Leptospira biflexa]